MPLMVYNFLPIYILFAGKDCTAGFLHMHKEEQFKWVNC